MPEMRFAPAGDVGDDPLVVSAFEWESLEYALWHGLPHPLDVELDNRNVIVDRRQEPRA